MRLIFMGTPAFAVPVLDALDAAGHEITAAYSQPPRPAGRGKKARPSPVQVRAEALGIEVRIPVSLKADAEQEAFAALGSDLAVVVAYGLILPQAILDAPAQGCLNVHASLLPRWRGAAPIHRAVLAGDATTGICIMQMEAGLDTGPVLLRESTDIAATDTTGDLHDRLSVMGARLAVRAVEQIARLSPVAQAKEGVTYAAKIDKAEARVDFGWNAANVVRHINGLSPSPGAWLERDGTRLKLLRAKVVEDAGGMAPDAKALKAASGAEASTAASGQDMPKPAPGTVLDLPGLVVATGQGAVELLEVQPAGKAPVAGADWRRGARLAVGDPLDR